LLHATAPSGLSSLAHSPESSNLKIKDLWSRFSWGSGRRMPW
jgi:hypothetical protein